MSLFLITLQTGAFINPYAITNIAGLFGKSLPHRFLVSAIIVTSNVFPSLFLLE